MQIQVGSVQNLSEDWVPIQDYTKCQVDLKQRLHTTHFQELRIFKRLELIGIIQNNSRGFDLTLFSISKQFSSQGNISANTLYTV